MTNREKFKDVFGLESISLSCDKCEFDGNCDIKTAYHKAKDYAAVSMELVDTKGDK